MFERDYLMRAIREFARVLARILAHKQNREFDKALTETAEASRALTGMDPEQLVRLPLDSVLGLARDAGELHIDKAAAIARLLKEHGELLALTQHGDAKPYFVRAFCVYDELSRQATDEQMADHQETLAWLLDRLE